MTYARNITIRTELLACNLVVNVTQMVEDLYSLYRRSSLTLASNVFYNISIVNFNCITPFDKYFEQLLVFTQTISNRIQIELASIYFDYLNQNRYLSNGLNGFFINREKPIYLSSISFNNTVISDACSSNDIIQDSLCPQNNSKYQCINLFSNPWIFDCSEYLNTSINPLSSTTNNHDLISNKNYSILSPWQIGLTGASSILFLLTLFLVIAYLYRRHTRSKTFVLKIEDVFDEINSMRQCEVPQDQIFQSTTMFPRIKPRNHATIAWIHENIDDTTSTYVGNYVNLKSPNPYKRNTYVDHTKIYESIFPSNIPKNSLLTVHISNNRVNAASSRMNSMTVGSPSAHLVESSMIQLKPMINQMNEDRMDSLNQTSLNRLNSKRFTTPASENFMHTLSIDESLHDEDAWISILDVVNAELDRLNRLESTENQLKTMF